MGDTLQSFAKDLFAGGTAGAISLLITAPIERIKIILQVQKTIKNSDCMGIAGCARHIFYSQGFLSFWRGNFANTLRVFPTSSISFALKENYKKVIFGSDINREKDFLKYMCGNVISGGAAGLTCLCLVYPLDFTRTRLAGDIEKGAERQFNGIVHCLRKIYSTDGIRGIYRGFIVSAWGILIYRGAYFGLYDTFSGGLAGKQILTKFLIAHSVVITSALIAYPFDTVRRMMMMQSGIKQEDWQYQNSMHCFKEIMRTRGVRGFYRGALSNVLVGVGSALILVLFDEIRSLL